MRLSLITPTRDRMALLEGLLRSLESQTYRDFEIIVAVDGSTDGTLTLLESIKRRNPFSLEIIALTGEGRAKARNAAIRAATGEVLVFMDDDLTLEPDVLARHNAFHEMFQNSIALGPVKFPDGVTRFSSRPQWVNVSGCNTSVPRVPALKTGLFDEELAQYGGEDLEWGYRLEQHGLKPRALADAVVHHHGPRIPSVEKARAAGFNAVMIAKKHGTRVAMQLGVHPTMLAAKRVVLNPVGDLLFRAAEDYAFERAYLEGARAGWEAVESFS
jgi:glycosyltransferase involved in cell wall biosynthesis